MSNYDDWRTETDRDYEHRMHVHDRGPRFTSPTTGFCTCGVETTRCVSQKSGYRWVCAKCGEAELRSIYERAARKIN